MRECCVALAEVIPRLGCEHKSATPVMPEDPTLQVALRYDRQSGQPSNALGGGRAFGLDEDDRQTCDLVAALSPRIYTGQ